MLRVDVATMAKPNTLRTHKKMDKVFEIEYSAGTIEEEETKESLLDGWD